MLTNVYLFSHLKSCSFRGHIRPYMICNLPLGSQKILMARDHHTIHACMKGFCRATYLRSCQFLLLVKFLFSFLQSQFNPFQLLFNITLLFLCHARFSFHSYGTQGFYRCCRDHHSIHVGWVFAMSPWQVGYDILMADKWLRAIWTLQNELKRLKSAPIRGYLDNPWNWGTTLESFTGHPCCPQ